MRIWKQITHGLVERGRRRSGTAALAALALAWAIAPPSHGATTPESRNFDHITTGFELLGQHRTVPCESCHANAIFKGTPTACGACHGIGTAVRATAKPASHILSTDQCQACHTPWAWNPAVNFDHTQALGSCSTCHNGVTAQGKGPTHVITDLECDVCHTTLSWAGAVFSHSGITSGCASCHNGVNAQGMVATHFPINDTGGAPTSCESCHSPTNYVAWGPGTLINHAAVTAMQCATCHETAAFYGMHPSTNTVAADSRPNATLDSKHPTTGDCSVCHNTLSFAGAASKPPTHIPTTAPCLQCHTNPAQNSQYSVTGTHQGVTGCLSCHGPTVANTFYNITIVTTPSSHMPIGSLDCNGSGCHTTTNVNPGGFTLGSASIASPTLTVAGHTTVAGAVAACQTCHETAPYIGMLASTTTAAGDSRPNATLDKNHPTTGDCGTCHTTTPTLAADLSASSEPANHIPTTAPCAQCHTTAGNYAAYSVTATHQGVTGCLSCHGSTVGPFANVTMVSTPANHFSVGTLDCNGSGCHSTTNVNPGGFKLGTASVASPTLTVAGHATIAAAVPACQTCHETAPYVGMLASTATTAGDSRPSATLDAIHPMTGDCGGCHTTTPIFANDQTGSAEPANHIPTSAPCAQCHTTAGNDALYSVTGTHQGVTGCLTCHGPAVATTFANVTIVTTPSSHFPVGSLDCNGSGCHTTNNVNSGGFKLGTASLANPTLTVAGHATIAAAVPACQTCHETSPYMGMIVGTASAWGDSRPTVYDSLHPTTGDCASCHSTTPTFASDMTSGSKPANHIPTTAPCAQCHTTANNYAQYSVTGTHQGVTGCATCHGPAVGPFDVTMVSTPATHFPIGTLDCNGSGCHTATNVNPGGFKLGTANISSPTLNAAGHITVGAAVGTCDTCHETAPYLGMIPSTATTAADSRPTALDSKHPTAGDCGNCHVQTPTFSSNLLPTAPKPANHIPTTAVCAQCHTTTGNFAVYDVTGVHQGLTGCATCHGAGTGPFAGPPPANTITIVGWPGASHIPVGTLDCNGSGCHTTTNVNPGGFKIGTASIASPTLTVAGHATVAAAVAACQTCHETAPYTGMIASNATAAGDSRPPAALDAIHPTSGDCSSCHTTTPVFANDQTGNAKPANHIPTTAACAQCHTTAGNYTLYSVTGTHQGVTGCLTCHGSTVATTFANVTIVATPSTHFAVGSLDCNGSGCHTTTNVNAGGFKIGAASLTSPTLTVAGHTTIAAAVPACQTCHETAPYVGMIVGTAAAWGDSRPTVYDKNHPTTGDCSGCHTTTPTFTTDQTGNAKPSNHIPTTAACAQCHTTVGNDALYSVTGTHQGVTGCLTCHGSTVATTFANVTIVTTPSNHFAVGSLDCNGSGCHTTTNVNAGGFKIGTASLTSPTLTVAGHTTIAAAVPACQTCHETAPYIGMIVGTAAAWGDSRPTVYDKSHPTTGDCNGCHTTTPTLATNLTGNSKPANHIPTSAACAQCHTTAGNYVAYSVTGTHQGVTGCLTCHGSTVATTFANITIVTTASNHFAVGSLDCNGSGCHTTTNVNAGGFKIGAASLTSPTLTVAGHTTIAAAVPACQTCHETAPYVGMIASTATAWGDSRPQAYDKSHPATGDCNGCHTTTPTFATNQSGSSAKPANHIPTTQACATCHTTAGNYAAYVMGATGHTGITSNCAQCHAYGLSFYNMAAPTLKQPAAGATGHIPSNPPNGTKAIACELCHSPTVFTVFSGTVMKHATVTTMTCMSCHETGMTWQTNTGTRLWTRPNGHHAGQDCGGGGCHNSRDKTALRPATLTKTPTTAATATSTSAKGSATAAATGPTVRPGASPGAATAASAATAPSGTSGPFNHATATGSCVGCHNGTAATGKLASHIVTTNSCQSCHTTLAWLPVRTVDHSQVIGTCVSCHNGTTAPGKPSNHIPTTAGCDSCHTTNGWLPARFDHAAVQPHTCNTCHNGLQAIGMARAHIPTTQQCDTCHGTLAWRPALINHSSFVGNCARCHNNTAATGLPPNHFVTHLDCSSCHSYPDWGLIRFHHTSVAYPGDHRVALTCASCHTTNTEQVAYAAPAYAGTCAGCHSKDYVAPKHPKIAGGRVSYTVGELSNCSGACHVYSDATLTTIVKSQPGPKHRVMDARF